MKAIEYLLVLIFILIFSYQSLNAENIRIAVIDYCPYQCIPENENGKIGFMPEIVKAIYEKEGYSLIFEQAPFRRTIVGTEEGRYDAVLNTNTAHSKLLILSKEKTGVLKQNFYVKKGNPWRYEGLKSLENIKVGSVVGYNYSPFNPEYETYLQKYKNTEKVQYIGKDDAPIRNFMKILIGRITTFNEDAALFAYITMKEGITDKFEVAGNLGDNRQYMGFSPKNPNSSQYAEIFDNSIRKMREKGDLDKILAKYGVEDWEQ